jgi:hypothetical protein
MNGYTAIEKILRRTPITIGLTLLLLLGIGLMPFGIESVSSQIATPHGTNNITFDPDYANAFQKIPSTTKIESTINVSFSELSFSTTTEKNVSYDIVEIHGYSFMTNVGEPMLPMKNIQILIPPDARFDNITITSYRKEELPGTYKLYPAQLPGPPVSNPYEFIFNISEIPFVEPNQTVYSSDQPYPGVLLDYLDDGYLAGSQIVTISTCPLQYVPSTGKLTLYKEINFEVNYKPSISQAVKVERRSKTSQRLYDAMVKSLIENPSDIKIFSPDITIVDTSVNRPFELTEFPSTCGSIVEYVIITDSPLHNEFQELADWKTKKGVPTVVRNVSWIEANFPGCDLQEKIRNFIGEAYSKWGTQWVLLGGDTDIIPDRKAEWPWYGSCNIPTDLYYSDLDRDWNGDGDAYFGESSDNVDLLPDLFIGRAPVGTSSEVATFVDKIFTYEKNPDLTYITKALLMAVERWRGQYTKDYIANNYIPGHIGVWKLYETGGNALLNRDNVLNCMNEGYHFINHIDHSGVNFMGTCIWCRGGNIGREHMDSLTNDGKFSILWSMGCDPNAFDHDSISEHFILNPSGGGVAFIGNTRAGYCWIMHGEQCAQDEQFFAAIFNDAFFDYSQHHIGMAFASTQGRTVASEDQYSYLMNLLGDPEMPVWTVTPTQMSPSIPIDTHFGTNVVTINVGVPYAKVCLYKEGEIYAYGETDLSGSITFIIRRETWGSVHCTITAQNYLPYEGDIPAGPEVFIPYLRYATHMADDDNIGPSSGNGDGAVDAGEVIELFITIKETRGGAAAGVSATLSLTSPDAYINILDGTAIYGDMGIGGTATNPLTDPYIIQVLPNCPDEHKVEFNLEILDDVGRKWKDEFTICIVAPNLWHSRNVVCDITWPNGVIEPGETVDLSINVTNGRPLHNRGWVGHGAAPYVTAILTTSDPYVTITQASVNIGDILPREEKMSLQKFTFDVSSSWPGHPDNLDFVLTMTDSHGRSWSHLFELTPPKTPTGSRAIPGKTSIKLAWSPNREPDLAGSNIYLSGVGTKVFWGRPIKPPKLNILPVTSSCYTHTNLASGTYYEYRVVAVDSSGNEGEYSIIREWTNPKDQLGWPKKISPDHIESSPAIADLDGNSANGLEIVVGSFWNGLVYAWHQDGTPLTGWPNNTGGWPNVIYSSPAIGDIDNDGDLEVVIGAGNNVYAWHHNGIPVSGWPITVTGSVSTSAIEDVDPGFLGLEIIVGASDGKIYAWHHDRTNVAGWPVDLHRYHISVFIEEEKSNDDEMYHQAESVGYFAFESDGNIIDDGSNIIGEVGEISVDHNWQTVTLTNTYSNPIVIAQPIAHDKTPAHVRIKNALSNSFDLKIENWAYLSTSHSTTKVYYIILEQGMHALADGRKLEAETINANDAWTPVPFTQSFVSPPVTLTQSQTFNDNEPIVTKTKDVRVGGFDVKVQEEEQLVTTGHAIETVGYIAIEAGIGTNNGIDYEFGKEDNVWGCDSYGNPQWHHIHFSQSFDSIPLFIGWIETSNQDDTAGLRYGRITSIFSSPAVGDLDGDAEIEVVIGSDNPGKVYAFNSDGTIVTGWPKVTSSNIGFSSAALGDLDGNGDIEIVVKDNQKIYVYNHEGVQLWFKTSYGDSSPALGDIDGDGDLEIAVGSSERIARVKVWHHNGDPVNGWPQETKCGAAHNPIIGDIDGDGEVEILVGSDNEKVYAWHSDGTRASGWPVKTGWLVWSTPTLGDIDLDGDIEVAVGSHDENVYVWDCDCAYKIEWGTLSHDVRRTGFYPPVITVDDEGDGDYTSIQEAINAASPGWTITVYSGTYPENVRVWQNVILEGIPQELGSGTDTGPPVVDGSGSDVFHIESDDVVINGFIIQNGFNGICVDYGFDNVKIHDNEIVSNNGAGVSIVDGCDYNTINNNHITDNCLSGISVSSSWLPDPVTNNVIIGNTIEGNADGISFFALGDMVTSGSVTDNKIIGNTISNNNYGIIFNSKYWFSSVDNNIIKNNIITNNNHGIFLLVEDSMTASVDGNQILNNYFENDKNADDNGNNIWNIARTYGRNIIGGDFLGGNYWHDYTGDDDGSGTGGHAFANDGIGDTLLPYNCGGNIINGGDWNPLVCPCACEEALYRGNVSNPEEKINSLRELRDEFLREKYVNFYYKCNLGIRRVLIEEPYLLIDTADLIVKYIPAVNYVIGEGGEDLKIEEEDVKEAISFIENLKKEILERTEEIGINRSSNIIKFLEEFEEQVYASKGKTFSQAFRDSSYYKVKYVINETMYKDSIVKGSEWPIPMELMYWQKSTKYLIEIDIDGNGNVTRVGFRRWGNPITEIPYDLAEQSLASLRYELKETDSKIKGGKRGERATEKILRQMPVVIGVVILALVFSFIPAVNAEPLEDLEPIVAHVNDSIYYYPYGNGTFGGKVLIDTLGGNPRTNDMVGRLADFDRDGNLDLIIDTASRFSDAIHLYYYVNDGYNFTRVWHSTLPAITPVWGSRITAADFDSDGYYDFIAYRINASNKSFYLFCNNQNNTFTKRLLTVDTGWAAHPREIEAADFNYDGRMDFLLADYESGGIFNENVSFYSGDGTGNFSYEHRGGTLYKYPIERRVMN